VTSNICTLFKSLMSVFNPLSANNSLRPRPRAKARALPDPYGGDTLHGVMGI